MNRKLSWWSVRLFELSNGIWSHNNSISCITTLQTITLLYNWDCKSILPILWGGWEENSDTYKYDKDNLTYYNGQKVSGYKGGNPKSYLGNTLTWSHGRQLMSVKPSAKKRLADGSPAQTATYTYAYDGSRLSKTVGKTSKSDGIKTEYILNGSLILAQNTTYPDGSKETLNFYYSSDRTSVV